jgi:protein tyrosine phosphatase (PTP) superfamily phosphohydrolase (DUF442 family)
MKGLLNPLVLLLCGLSFNASAAGSAPTDGLENYREYSQTLSSSGQPDEKQLKALKKAGFERVVFLAFSDDHGSLPNEDRIVKEAGMDYAHIPVVWDAPSKNDFHAFAAVMSQAPELKTLVHCQVNFRASSFSFLYRVLHQDVPMGQAKDDLDSVWVPNETWRKLIFAILEENGRSPHCDACLWDTD